VGAVELGGQRAQLGVIAEYERAKIAERYRRGKLVRSRAGEVLAWRTPYGYRPIPATRTARPGWRCSNPISLALAWRPAPFGAGEIDAGLRWWRRRSELPATPRGRESSRLVRIRPLRVPRRGSFCGAMYQARSTDPHL
jgi:hypothetical protein